MNESKLEKWGDEWLLNKIIGTAKKVKKQILCADDMNITKQTNEEVPVNIK